MAQDKHLRRLKQRNNMSVPHTKASFQAAGSHGTGEWQDSGIFGAGCGSKVYVSEKIQQIQANAWLTYQERFYWQKAILLYVIRPEF